MEWQRDPDLLKTMLELKLYQVGDEIEMGQCGNIHLRGRQGVIVQINTDDECDFDADPQVQRRFRYKIRFELDSGMDTYDCTGYWFRAWRRSDGKQHS